MNHAPRFTIARPILLSAVVIGNLAFWAIPSRVVELVAREQQVLLGRYSLTRFVWMVGVAAVSAAAIYILRAREPRDLRRRVFGAVASFLAVVPCLIAGDLILRFRTDYPYAPGSRVYHRPPGRVYRLTYEDMPLARRSYPVIRPGFGRVDCVLSYDSNGFRNNSVPQSCDIITLGDSFTEGSRVSDHQPWPVRLEARSGLRVYNLGISGYSPAEYLASLKAYGLSLSPKLVVCMLYEGNDFRSAEVEARAGVSPLQFIRSSPLLRGMYDLMIRLCGGIGASSAFADQGIVAWLPVACPPGPDARYYAFAPKQLLELDVSRDQFQSSEPWFAAKGILRAMHEACSSIGARLIIAYAPNKAHVVFPLVAASVDADELRGFASIRAGMVSLPPAAGLAGEITANLDDHETVIGEWCGRQSIPCLSLTSALRAATRRGQQAYYTYDQHWSPVGHEIACEEIKGFIEQNGLAPSRNERATSALPIGRQPAG